MSMDLAELGHVICQDFDNRVLDLNTIRSESDTKLKTDCNELVQHADDDRVKLQTARREIWKDTLNLFIKCKEETITMLDGLRDEDSKNSEELKAWAQEQGKDLKGWYAAGAYLLRKRTGR